MASSMEGSTGTGTVPQIVYGVACNEQTIEINYPGREGKTKLSNRKLQKRQLGGKVTLIRPTKECVFVPELRGMNAV